MKRFFAQVQASNCARKVPVVHVRGILDFDAPTYKCIRVMHVLGVIDMKPSQLDGWAMEGCVRVSRPYIIYCSMV